MVNMQSEAKVSASSRPDATGGESYEVAILGGGVGGSMLAAILARHGVQVLLVEAESHPRFAIGESTVPETAGLLRIVGERYSIPEIAHIAAFQSVRHHVSSACGVKRGFTFLYHREGEPQRPEESTQFPALPPPYGPDVHWFRQDIDSYMFAAAIRYGATARQRLRITKIERPNGVWQLASDKGERFTSRYLVDAGGIRSPLAELYGLRDEPPRQRTDSRSMFTHMIGVRPYEQCVPDPKAFGFYNPAYQGTLHHLFDGGWFWVIPFDNYPESTNPLCSVGLTLDRRKYPSSDLSADEEFRAFLKRFPSIAVQFENARPVREWIRSNARIQFSSRQAMGEGYCLLPHAAGFIDPLFSSGLTITVAFVSNLAARLIRAKQENDYALQRFAPLEEWLQYNLNYFDRMVSSAYNSWADFQTWNAWFRIWSLGTYYGTFSPITVQAFYMQTGDRNKLAVIEETPYRGVGANEFPPFLRLFDTAYGHMEAFRAGEITAQTAADRIFKAVRDADFVPPQLRAADPSWRAMFAATTGPILKNYFWGSFLAAKIVRDTYYDIRPMPLAIIFGRSYLAELRRSLRAMAAFTRDHFFTWNKEWKHPRYDVPAPARPALTPLSDKPAVPRPYVSSAREESVAAS